MADQDKKGGCLKWGLVAASGAFLLGVLGLVGAGNEEAEQQAEAQALAEAEEVTADEMFEAFARNEVAAKARFDGKPVRITGAVKSIDLDVLGNPQVQLEAGGAYDHVVLGFDEDQAGKAALLAPGEFVTALCRRSSEVLGNPYARECVIE